MTEAPIRVHAPAEETSFKARARDAKGRLMPRKAPEPAPMEDTGAEVKTGAKRVPLGQHVSKLSYPPRPGYAMRWVSDLPGRVDRALAAGWSHVKDLKSKTPVKQVTDPSLGMSGRQGFLMEIPEALYNEDQAIKVNIIKNPTTNATTPLSPPINSK
jgi:hypothetical protein